MSTHYDDEFVDIEDGHLDSLEAERDDARPMALWSVLGIVFVAVAIGFVVYDGLKSETYFYTVDQAVAQGEELPGQRVRVKGVVEPGSIVGEKGHLGRTFRIAENGKSLAVTYDEALPDTFAESVEVVVQGEVDDDNVLIANEVLVKCPSRYEGNPPTAQDQPQASL